VGHLVPGQLDNLAFTLRALDLGVQFPVALVQRRSKGFPMRASQAGTSLWMTSKSLPYKATCAPRQGKQGLVGPAGHPGPVSIREPGAGPSPAAVGCGAAGPLAVAQGVQFSTRVTTQLLDVIAEVRLAGQPGGGGDHRRPGRRQALVPRRHDLLA
jgi:hypothetical protein